MATEARTKAGLVPVRLSQVPLELRLSMAHDLAARWRLRGMDYAVFLLAAQRPVDDPELWVTWDARESVLAGVRPKGETPKELYLPPVAV